MSSNPSLEILLVWVDIWVDTVKFIWGVPTFQFCHIVLYSSSGWSNAQIILSQVILKNHISWRRIWSSMQLLRNILVSCVHWILFNVCVKFIRCYRSSWENYKSTFLIAYVQNCVIVAGCFFVTKNYLNWLFA